MEINNFKAEKFSQSITLKAVIIGFLTLLMLIPGSMIQGLIQERQARSQETISKINAKWSNSQTINGPVLVIPYQKKTTDSKNNAVTETHSFTLAPENLSIKSTLIPEERHYGIYKSILYNSKLLISGNFKPTDSLQFDGVPQWQSAYLRIGISDLRGISNNIDFDLNGKHFGAFAGGGNDFVGEGLIIPLKNTDFLPSNLSISFSSKLDLKGSSDINFIPVAQTTNVKVSGKWKSPGFIGSFTPEYKLDNKGFNADWKVLHFNRNIPETWTDTDFSAKEDMSFGVNLINTVDHYQLNMRSAKYSLMFIALTFVVFFFVELLTRTKIHPIQYLLVGIALILFYSLLLSLSEQLSFGLAYLLAGIATIGLIVVFAHKIFKNRKQTGILALILTILYIYLYVILQLEDVAMLIGSIGLFIILAIIMFLTQRIKWYKDELLEK